MSKLLQSYRHERVIAQDSKTKTVTLLGSIHGENAIISAEKSAFDVDDIDSITKPQDIFEDLSNNIYLFVSQRSDPRGSPSAKYSLIYPATETHIRKYAQQKRRMIAETAALYEKVVLPYILGMIGERIRWVHNILDHKAETDRILFEDPDPMDGFILLPDLKWDGTTLSSLYMVCIVHRRDIKSLRDLSGEHVDYLRHLRDASINAVCSSFTLEPDQLRVYIHYQPSYYHFHVHVQTCDYEAGEGQAIGKAYLLDDVIETLVENGTSFKHRTLYYSLGEDTDLYKLLNAQILADKAAPLRSAPKSLRTSDIDSATVTQVEQSPVSPRDIEAMLADLNVQREMLLSSIVDQ